MRTGKDLALGSKAEFGQTLFFVRAKSSRLISHVAVYTDFYIESQRITKNIKSYNKTHPKHQITFPKILFIFSKIHIFEMQTFETVVTICVIFMILSIFH